MDRHLDFTIDFETCSLSADAAPMQVAVVPWLRDSEEDPFSNGVTDKYYVGYVDLRSCVVDGFDFDPETVRWWARQGEDAKKAVTDGFPEPVSDVLIEMLDYIRDIVRKKNLESICLWCQGTDVDIAILRSLCRRYDVDLEDIAPHTSFRDCRTVILEAALLEARRRAKEGGIDKSLALWPHIQREPSKAYTLYKPLPPAYAEGREAHDALYDAYRSSWNTWQALRWLGNIND